MVATIKNKNDYTKLIKRYIVFCNVGNIPDKESWSKED